MSGFFKNNKVIIKLSNTESIQSSIYKYTDFKKVKTSGTSSTASYFISTSNDVSNLILDFLDCGYYPFVVDVSKVKDYIVDIDRCLYKISKYDFHGELKDYYRYKSYYVTTDDSEFSLGKAYGGIDESNRSYLKFENDNENVMKFRGIVIAILSNLVIEKRNNINYIYPVIKEGIYEELLNESNDVEYTDESINKEMFKKWLISQSYATGTVEHYVNSISITSREAIADGILDRSLYLYSNPEEVKKIFEVLKNNDTFNKRTQLYDYVNISAINSYISFLSRDKSEVIDVVDDAEYDPNIKFDSMNKIYYGGPGCGKSKLVSILYGNDDSRYIRTTFYPDYTNSDFVGQLIPMYEDGELKYKIQPGPFTKALEKALKNRNKDVYLIIEEINRGNAAAIFGDIFQLLDRNELGESDYCISNYIIEKYIGDNVKNVNIKNNVKIPPNLSIIATMNTSDQNVYTLDSAFKRRWKMEYISNNFCNNDISKDYDREIGSLMVPMLHCDITWKKFVKKINEAIINENSFGINSEDKQIGKYFVNCSDLITRETLLTNDFQTASNIFAEKVLMYIWEDIARLEPKLWFRDDIKTFEVLVDKYITDGIDVFSENIKNVLRSDSNEI